MPIEPALPPETIGAVDERNRAAQVMALRLGETGSGRFTPEVEVYQRVWNSTRWATHEQMQMIGMSAAQATQKTPQLVTDGLFGPNTSATLCSIVGDPCPPRRAPGMPVWVAQNMNRLMALVPPSGPPVEELIEPVSSPPVTNPQPDVSSGSSVVQVTVAETTTQTSQPPPPTITEVEEPEPAPEPEPVPVEPVSYDVLSMDADLEFANEPGLETPIATTRPQSRAPFFAIFAGAAVLGGAFWWFQYGRGKRRRRA